MISDTKPVSYTHLDNPAYHLHKCFSRRSLRYQMPYTYYSAPFTRFATSSMCSLFGSPTMAVSYTHLQIFVRVLSDRTADYLQVSRELSELGWSGNHEYMCLILQITYLNQQNLSTRAICRYIKKKLEDSVSFLYQDEICLLYTSRCV